MTRRSARLTLLSNAYLKTGGPAPRNTWSSVIRGARGPSENVVDVLRDGVVEGERGLVACHDGLEVGVVDPQDHDERATLLLEGHDAAVDLVRRRVDEDVVEPKFLHRVHDEVGGGPRGRVVRLRHDLLEGGDPGQRHLGQFTAAPERLPLVLPAV